MAHSSTPSAATPQQKGIRSFITDMLMGGTSGVLAKTACAPLERVKILLQTQQGGKMLPGGVVPYRGFLDAMVRVPREQGVMSFWRGNLANCLRYFPTQAMNFAFKDKYQKMFVRPREEVSFPRFFAGYLAAGGAAGATALTASYPLEYTFTRLAADRAAKKQYSGIVDCVTKV
jgi:solute carrier family 25 (mitochondrial adenine nucleotide translocator), member 4/5/6/31